MLSGHTRYEDLLVLGGEPGEAMEEEDEEGEEEGGREAEEEEREGLATFIEEGDAGCSLDTS